ncbi:hypothetical protein MFIFM68171_05357 [Madurella fahalii]|uniref:Mediator of RNA polymerase II transcription subunit 1 n=1 Tax=Madurella fahalii TaxID=1157608 RepID=A0ABQ0GBM7_9PEZI
MSTPTPGKHPLTQQGRTPSQAQHGAAATPPVSTPFSVAQAAISPHGPRSSPQQVKKSPATATMGGHPSSAAVTFDTPAMESALGALHIGPGLDMGLRALGALGRASEDERAKRLDDVIGVLSRSKGLVSEAGLERLAKKLELEFIWETSMGSDEKRTLIVAGSALELLIEFSNNIVQSVSLNFPDSAEIVNKHAKSAGEILFKDLQLGENQSPLTKSLESFAANFERLATLDKLSTNPGLNLYEAVAGVYESLNRLHLWELQKVREDPSLSGKSDAYLENLVICTKSGKPAMNARGRLGMSFEYWKESRLWPSPSPEVATWAAEHKRTWSMLIDCTVPLVDVGVSPVRISDKWIGVDVEKQPHPDEMHTGGSIIDWLEPESTFIPTPDQLKGETMQNETPLLGPRLPEAVFRATFDPPVHLPLSLWQQFQQLGCGAGDATFSGTSFDGLVIPAPPGKPFYPADARVVTCDKKTLFVMPGESTVSLKSHANTLHVDKVVWSKTLTEVTFSHPQQLVSMLPYLRQYVFLATLLENSFKEQSGPPAQANGKKPVTQKATRTTQDDFDVFMAQAAEDTAREGLDNEATLKIDVVLSGLDVPRLQVHFPFRDGVANIALEIRENGHVHVESQNVLDERNMMRPDGRQRRVEDIGAVLENFEDLGKWAEFIRTRWA